MPFAQFHYPFENKEKFEQSFPGDFIAEYVGQVRAWFYYLHAISIGLFGKRAFKNVIVTGTILGEDGRKLSKSLNNYTDPNTVMDQYGADSLRYLLLSSPVLAAEDFSLINKDIADTARKLSMIWNMYDFFSLYASVDKWEWLGDTTDPLKNLTNPLDRWIVSRVHQLTDQIETSMKAYDIPRAMKPIAGFVDDASNWYVRRSRRRFWKSDNDSDKQNAYKTLHYVLMQLSIVMAPFTPFLSEELYRKLTGGVSVHLLDWPLKRSIDQRIIDAMAKIREMITLGLAQRASSGLKVRQPLQSVTIESDVDINQDLIEIIMEELNVKKVVVKKSKKQEETTVSLDTVVTEQLRKEGIVRELIRLIQNARKDAGLEVEDRISLLIESESPEILGYVDDFKDLIKGETLAEEFLEVPEDAYSVTSKVEGLEVRIFLSKYMV
jgi:isoleucyl-tRNA synthetase